MIARALFVLAVLLGALAPGCTCKKKPPAQNVEVADDGKSVGTVQPRSAADRARRPASATTGDAGAEAVAPEADPAAAGRDGGVATKTTGTADAPPVRQAPPRPEEIRSPADPYYDAEINARATVSLGEPRVLEGTRDPKRLAAVLDRVRKPIAQCHQRALEANPELAGQVVFDLTIDERGVITNATITRNDLGPDVARCAELRVRGSRFGSGERSRVSLPLSFKGR